MLLCYFTREYNTLKYYTLMLLLFNDFCGLLLCFIFFDVKIIFTFYSHVESSCMRLGWGPSKTCLTPPLFIEMPVK